MSENCVLRVAPVNRQIVHAAVKFSLEDVEKLCTAKYPCYRRPNEELIEIINDVIGTLKQLFPDTDEKLYCRMFLNGARQRDFENVYHSRKHKGKDFPPWFHVVSALNLYDAAFLVPVEAKTEADLKRLAKAKAEKKKKFEQQQRVKKKAITDRFSKGEQFTDEDFLKMERYAMVKKDQAIRKTQKQNKKDKNKKQNKNEKNQKQNKNYILESLCVIVALANPHVGSMFALIESSTIVNFIVAVITIALCPFFEERLKQHLGHLLGSLELGGMVFGTLEFFGHGKASMIFFHWSLAKIEDIWIRRLAHLMWNVNIAIFVPEANPFTVDYYIIATCVVLILYQFYLRYYDRVPFGDWTIDFIFLCLYEFYVLVQIPGWLKDLAKGKRDSMWKTFIRDGVLLYPNQIYKRDKAINEKAKAMEDLVKVVPEKVFRFESKEVSVKETPLWPEYITRYEEEPITTFTFEPAGVLPIDFESKFEFPTESKIVSDVLDFLERYGHFAHYQLIMFELQRAGVPLQYIRKILSAKDQVTTFRRIRRSFLAQELSFIKEEAIVQIFYDHGLKFGDYDHNAKIFVRIEQAYERKRTKKSKGIYVFESRYMDNCKTFFDDVQQASANMDFRGLLGIDYNLDYMRGVAETLLHASWWIREDMPIALVKTLVYNFIIPRIRPQINEFFLHNLWSQTLVEQLLVLLAGSIAKIAHNMYKNGYNPGPQKPLDPADEAIRFEGVLGEIKKHFTIVIDSDLFDTIKKIIVLGYTHEFVDQTVFDQVSEYIKLPSKKLSWEESFDYLSSVEDAALGIITRFSQGYTWKEIMFSMSLGDNIPARFNNIISYKDRLTMGLPMEGHMDFLEYSHELRSLKLQVKAKLLERKLDDRERMKLKDIVNNIDKELADIVLKQQGMNRGMPFGVVIHGEPSIGKSNLLDHTFKCWSTVKGRPYKSHHVFHKGQEGEYFEGLDTQPGLHISEMGNQSKSQIQKNPDTLMPILQSIMSSEPCILNMAFGDKGKRYALFEIVGIDTNNPDMHLEETMYCPVAMRRRFLFVLFKVKPEFTKDGSTAIDTKKSAAAGGDLLDRYYIECVRHEPGWPKEGKVVFSTDSFVEYERWLAGEMRKHIETQENTKNIAMDRPIILEDVVGFPNPMPEGADPLRDLRFESVTKYTRTYWSCFNDFARSVITKDSFTGAKGERWEFCYVSEIVLFILFILLLLGRIYLFELFLLLSIFLFSIVPYVPIIKREVTDEILQPIKTAKKSVEDAISSASEAVYATGRTLWNRTEDIRLRAKLFLNRIRDFQNLARSDLVKIFIVPTLMAIGGIAYTYLRKHNYISQAATVFYTPSDLDKDINRAEEEIGCKPALKRIPNVLAHSLWNDMIVTDSKPVPHKESPTSLVELTNQNTRFVRVFTNDDLSKYLFQRVLGIKGSYALINTHSLGDMNYWPKVVQVGRSDASMPLVTNDSRAENLHKTDIIDLGNDLCLIRLSKQLFQDVTEHLADTEIAGRGKCYTANGDFRYAKMSPIVIKGVYLKNLFSYTNPVHELGDCGTSVIVPVKDGYQIAGLHCAGEQNGDAIATKLDRELILDAVKTLNGDRVEMLSEPKVYPKLEEPKSKSVFRFENLPNVDFYGYTGETIIMENRSRLRKSIYKSDGRMKAFLENEFNMTIDEPLIPPLMRPIVRKDGTYVSPYNVNMRKMVSGLVRLDKTILKRVEDELVDHIVKGLKDGGITEVAPLTLAEAINGAENNPFIRRINASTGAGEPFGGKKNKHIPLVDHPDCPDDCRREMTEEVRKHVLKYYECSKKRERVWAVNTAHLKDEPRPMSKATKGNTRLFYASNLAHLIVSRQMLAPFYSLMTEFSDLFQSAVGYNMHLAAGDVVNRLSKFPNANEGDYEKYDIRTPSEFGDLSCNVARRVLKAFGYTEQALNMLDVIFTESMFPVIMMLQEYFIKVGLQPSGKYGTAEDNSLKNLGMLMYSFYSIFPEKNFFDFVVAIILGDDLLWTCHDDVKDKFNSEQYAEFCREHYNMIFTPATKNGRFNNNVKITDCTFLKRNFVFLEREQRWIAPLALTSIYKSFEWTMPSKHLTPEQHMTSVINSALYEIFFHAVQKGDDAESSFNAFKSLACEVLEESVEAKNGEIYDSLPTYWELYARLLPSAA